MRTSQTRFTLSRFFSRFVFPTILEAGTGLFRLERNLNVIWDEKIHNILPTYLFAKALVPSKSKFLLVFHALTVCDTTSFSAGHGIAKILKIFAFFSLTDRKHCCYWMHEIKYWDHLTCLCGRAEERAHHLHSYDFWARTGASFKTACTWKKTLKKHDFMKFTSR